MSDPGGARPTRAERSDQVQRRRRVQAVVVSAVVAVILIVVVTRSDGGGEGATPSVTPSSSVSVAAGPAQLLALSVTGAPNALLATVGAGGGRASAALVLPPELTIVMPGSGEVLAEELQELPGDSMRIGVSNADGAWNDHYAVMDLARFGAVVDRFGGLTVELQDVYAVGAEVLGPGTTRLTGDQVVALLDEDADDTSGRWASVVDAFLAARPSLSPTDLAETDDPQAAAAMLGSGGAQIEIMPTQIVGGAALIPAQPDLDELMGQLFGTPMPVRAEVQNGNGEPGVGEEVGAQLIPAGFRIVLSVNADTFEHRTTEVIAAGTENEPAAQDAKKALGVGKVIVSQVPSGLADVTVIVGKDYQG